MDRLRVWVNDKPVGRLARHGRGSTFVYDPDVDPADAVSLNMPVRAASYDVRNGMLPVFDTNIPEGELLTRVRRALAKDDRGRVDPIDILALTGGNQIGRLRLLPEGETPERRDPIGTIDAILAEKSSSALIGSIIERYALRSGVSGAMPKILANIDDPRSKATVQTRDWILKFDADDYPGLSLNEFHCLEASRLAGNLTAEAYLSDDGHMLAVKRFDAQGEQRSGFEDFASLNGKVAEQKYEGSIETHLMKMAKAFSGPQARENLERLFRQVVTSIGVRNGDAHLKNYALLFDDARAGPFTLAPAYDIVTTRAFDMLKHDTMALTLGGTKRWPDRKSLRLMGARAQLTPKETDRIIAEVADGISRQLPEMVASIRSYGYHDLADRMATEWNDGLVRSLGAEPVPVMEAEPGKPAPAAVSEDSSAPAPM